MRAGTLLFYLSACPLLLSFTLYMIEYLSGRGGVNCGNMDLKAALNGAGIEAVLVKKHNSIAVVASYLDCDSYQFLEGNPAAVNSYRGDYLPYYSWAEFSVGMFE